MIELPDSIRRSRCMPSRFQAYRKRTMQVDLPWVALWIDMFCQQRGLNETEGIDDKIQGKRHCKRTRMGHCRMTQSMALQAQKSGSNNADKDIEIKDGTLINVADVFLLNQCGPKATVDKKTGRQPWRSPASQPGRIPLVTADAPEWWQWQIASRSGRCVQKNSKKGRQLLFLWGSQMPDVHFLHNMRIYLCFSILAGFPTATLFTCTSLYCYCNCTYKTVITNFYFLSDCCVAVNITTTNAKRNELPN